MRLGVRALHRGEIVRCERAAGFLPAAIRALHHQAQKRVQAGMRGQIFRRKQMHGLRRNRFPVQREQERAQKPHQRAAVARHVMHGAHEPRAAVLRMEEEPRQLAPLNRERTVLLRRDQRPRVAAKRRERHDRRAVRRKARFAVRVQYDAAAQDGVRAQNLLNGRPQYAFLHDGRNFRRGAYRRAGRHQMNSFFVNSVVHGDSSVFSAQSALRRPRPAWRGSAEERARVKPFQWLPAAHTVAHGDIR